jgi:hypothetical protein
MFVLLRTVRCSLGFVFLCGFSLDFPLTNARSPIGFQFMTDSVIHDAYQLLLGIRHIENF